MDDPVPKYEEVNTNHEPETKKQPTTKRTSTYVPPPSYDYNNDINDYKPTCPVIFFERGNNADGHKQIV